MLVVFPPECTGYSTPSHPESPDRVRRIYEVLRKRGMKFTSAEPAARDDILRVHTERHYERIMGMNCSGIETPPVDPKYPLLSAGAALKAARTLGFSLSRPPGHHAGPDSLEGFCYFNNVAIAVRKEGRKTAILDLDVHHGNGTQAVFLGDSSAIYVSVHQVPLYPMTGLKSEKNCHNFPLLPGTDEKTYIRTLEKALEIVKAFKPELLAVSMGFDTYKGDPLAGQQLTGKGYERIGSMVSGLGMPTFIVLEGGYSPQIGDLCWSFIKEF